MRWIVATTVALVIFAGALRATAMNATCVKVDVRTTPEPGAVKFFKERASRGRLLVWFTWGEYALWHLAPDLRVSVDGRRETVYSEALQQRHLRFYFDTPGGAALPTEIAADYVWIPRRLPAAERLTTAGWTPIYTGAESVIFARAPHDEPPRQPPDDIAPSRCFPNP